MKFHILLLGLSLGQVLSLRAKEGCEVRSSWNINYMWNEIHLSTWNPSEIKEPVSIDVEFVGQIKPVTYDNIKIYHNYAEVTRTREGKVTHETYQFPESTPSGWADFVLTVDSQYGLKNMQSIQLLPSNISVDYLPNLLTVAGSNVTVNCKSDTRFWNINNGPVAIPLTDSEEHWLSFYSKTEFSPEVVLEQRDFPLGWYNGSLTTIPTRVHPLPPFFEHHLTLICKIDNNENICNAKIGEERILGEVLRIAYLPNFIVIRRKNHSPDFQAFLHSKDPIAKEVSPEQEASACHNYKVALAVLVCISVTAVTMAFVFIKMKYSRTKQEIASPLKSVEEASLNSQSDGISLTESGLGSMHEGS